MSRFTPDELRVFMGGRWIVSPPGDLSAVGIGTDSREGLKDRAFIALRGERFDGHDHLNHAARAGALVCVVDRDVARDERLRNVGILRVDDTRRALGRLALAYRRNLSGTRVIAVTGSAGKTTTKSLIHGVLSSSLTGTSAPKSYNNDIGVPLTILSAQRSDRYLVLELGTNAPGEIAQLARLAEPEIAVITNAGRAHLAGFGSLDAIVREKMSLLCHVREGGLAVVNANQPVLREFVPSNLMTILCGSSDQADLHLTARGRDEEGAWFEVNHRDRFHLPLPGLHNAMNALFSLAVARRFGLADSVVRDALARAEPPPMRMTMGRLHGVNIFNDAYNANPESMRASIEAFIEATPGARGRHLVLGDMLELGDEAAAIHEEFGRYILTLKQTNAVHMVYLIGAGIRSAADVLAYPCNSSEILWSLDPDRDALSRVASMIGPNDSLLVKASRGMRLERCIEQLEPLLGSRDRSKHGATQVQCPVVTTTTVESIERNLTTPSS